MTWITAFPWQSTACSTIRAKPGEAVGEGGHGSLLSFRFNVENMDGRGVDIRDSLRDMTPVHAIASPAMVPPTCWADGVGNPPGGDRIAVAVDKCRVVHLFRALSRGACG